ncbi:glycosyltransferase family 2 protein [Aquitalea sp. S1-19]|nr:glycosyltransferase family 2 protein [Aquitalea sp. S1-19]
MSANNEVALAVVVIGRNEGARLHRCLMSVLESDWPRSLLELIYVDSGSSDDSCQVAARAGARVLSAGMAGAGAARNAGWQACSAEWVMFLDGDTVLAPHFLRFAMQALREDAGAACVWGHRREMAPEQSLYVRVLDLDWRYPPGDTLFCGGDVLFQRAALLDAGGYNPAILAGEEPELCERIRGMGGRIVHLDTEMTLHDLAITCFRQYWQRAERSGYAYEVVSQYTRSLWRDEVHRALFRALVLAALPLASLLGAWFFGIAAAVLPWCALSLLILRTAWRARWRCADAATLFCYGVHSWFEQLPIAVGILRGRLGGRMPRAGAPVSYKERSE